VAETEGRFSKARLEAFSDDVIAVIITIMAPKLRSPENDRLGDLLDLWPALAIWRDDHEFEAAARACKTKFWLSVASYGLSVVVLAGFSPFSVLGMIVAISVACVGPDLFAEPIHRRERR
jgi:hypothetical protein